MCIFDLFSLHFMSCTLENGYRAHKYVYHCPSLSCFAINCRLANYSPSPTWVIG